MGYYLYYYSWHKQNILHPFKISDFCFLILSFFDLLFVLCCCFLSFSFSLYLVSNSVSNYLFTTSIFLFFLLLILSFSRYSLYSNIFINFLISLCFFIFSASELLSPCLHPTPH